MTTPTATTSGTLVVPDVALFTVADATVTAAQVVAHLDGPRLDAVRREVAAGAAARRRAEVDDADRRAAEQAFRHQRRLVAADEMEAWLTSWHLDVATWRAQVRRQVALARDGVAAARPGDDVDDRDLWAALVVGGELADAARTLARQLAAAVADGRSPDEAGPDHLADWLLRAVSDAQVEREVAERGLDWTRVGWEVLHADTQDAAREARLCLVDDGRPPEEVARLLGRPLVTADDWLHRAPADLREQLLGVDVDHCGAPTPVEDAWRLVRVVRRRRPDPDDPEVRAAVRDHLADQALDLEVRDRVVWHVSF